MLARVKNWVGAHWEVHSRRPFLTLLRVFAARVFHGGDASDGSMQVGLAIIVILLALPGTLVSLLLFEKYGSLVRWMRGDGSFDPFTASIPDEYFFVVLSMVVTGAAALWRWDALFLDRRDYTNIVPLPISLRRIFLANLGAILLLAGVLTIDVNAGSFVLFPVVVTGSQNSLSVFLRFGFGHAATVVLASAFSFLLIFAVIGLLMAILPYSAFRRVSMYVRFLLAVVLLAFLVTGFAVPSFLGQVTAGDKHLILALPPVWFIGICETLWGNGSNPLYAEMARCALSGLAVVLAVAVFSYALSFRRSFVRIPETAELGPLPRSQFRFLPTGGLDRVLLREPVQRACFHFVTRTLLRSEAHLQIASAFVAIGLVLGAQALVSGFGPHTRKVVAKAVTGVAPVPQPSEEWLSIPFILAFFTVVGVRLAFEVPSELRANWLFALWVDAEKTETRAVARKILFGFSLVPLLPLCLASSWVLWGPQIAALHTAIFAGCTIVLIELLLLRFRKIPFTCAYPPFQSQSALTFVAYFFGFVLFSVYLPEMELWSLADPWRALFFVPVIAIALIGAQQYRKQLLDVDKQLIFEETPASIF